MCLSHVFSESIKRLSHCEAFSVFSVWLSFVFGAVEQIRQLLKAEERSTVKLSSELIVALTTEESDLLPFSLWFGGSLHDLWSYVSAFRDSS